MWIIRAVEGTAPVELSFIEDGLSIIGWVDWFSQRDEWGGSAGKNRGKGPNAQR